jgi:hypothetical protein
MTASTHSASSDVARCTDAWRGTNESDVVPILHAGVLARRFCNPGCNAEVEAVFEQSFYLRSGDAFVCVGGPTIGNGPLTLLADFGGLRPSASLGVRPDQPVFFFEQRFSMGDVTFTFDRCTPWHQPPWPRALSLVELNDVCDVIVRRMRSEAPRESLGRASLDDPGGANTPLAHTARPRIDRFASWLLDALRSDVPASTPMHPIVDLVGLGPGLTPSGDDFLIGALALLDALSERDAHAELARAIAAIPRGRTSALSECLLKTAAAGHLGADLCDAVSAVVSGAPDQALAAIRRIGHSSGWDMLAGILTTLRVVATLDASSSPRRSV